MKIKFILKKVLLEVLYRLGFIKFLRYKNRHKICVIMVHGVMESRQNSLWEPLRPQVSPGELSRVLDILSSYYQFVTVDQAVSMLAGKIPFIDNALLVTFDDGYRNNIDFALPICKRFSIKPILFVTTSNIDSRLPFWVDRLDYALQQCMGELISLQYLGEVYQFDATSRKALQESYKLFRDHCKGKFDDDVKMSLLFNALSEMLESISGKALSHICEGDDWSGIVSWDDLREAVQENCLDVASHTVDHWRLDCLSQQQLVLQLQDSKMRIEQELATDCKYFCYPNGNYNKQSVNFVRNSGYQAAFSTDIGLSELNDDLMTLKRFSLPVNKSKSELLYLLNR